MGTKVKFAGKVVRAEPGGFGVIHFDEPVGPSGNTHGIVSSSSGTSTATFSKLKPGTRVVGTADVDERDVASVTEVAVNGEE
jgi:hypothetical protein